MSRDQRVISQMKKVQGYFEKMASIEEDNEGVQEAQLYESALPQHSKNGGIIEQACLEVPCFILIDPLDILCYCLGLNDNFME